MKNIPDPIASMFDPQLLILFLEVIYKFLGSGPLVEKMGLRGVCTFKFSVHSSFYALSAS